MRNPWIIAQFAVAAVLLVLAAIGIVGQNAFGVPEAVFSLSGEIQSYAIFPGLVVSLVVNALVMRRPLPPNTALKILLGIEFVLIASLILYHFWTDEAGNTFGLAIVTWPFAIGLATAIVIVAAIRRLSMPKEPQV